MEMTQCSRLPDTDRSHCAHLQNLGLVICFIWLWPGTVILPTILLIMCQGPVWGGFTQATRPPFSFRGILANERVTASVPWLPGGKREVWRSWESLGARVL